MTIKNIQLLIQKGQFQAALDAANLMIEQQPCIDSFYLAAVSSRYLDKHSAAIDYINQLQQLESGYGRAYQELGHLYKAQSPEVALDNYKLAVKFNPSLVASWQAIAAISKQTSDLDAAQTNLDYLSRLPRELVSVISFTYEHKLEKAEKLCKFFLAKQPSHPEGMRLLAKIAEKHNIVDDAQLLLEACLNIEANNLWAQFDYINILHRRQKFEQAHQHALQLHQQLPNDVSAILTLANQEAAVGLYEQAIEHYLQVIQLDSQHAIAQLMLGHTYKTIGEQAKAVDSYFAALAADPYICDAYWSLANLKTFKFEKSTIHTMLALLDAPLNDNEKVQLHFALGKAFEESKQFEQAFEHYQLGNQLKCQQVQYDKQVMANNFSLQQDFFDAEMAAQLRQLGHQDNAPIFILGLPRTGSTLIEQILSSHSQIDGTLELPNILSYVQELNGRKYRNSQARYPKILNELQPQDFQEFGQRFIDETKIHRQGGMYFIDKMPNNFRHIGLIKSILPNAKIIDTRRDPVTCCFSIFKQLFAEGQEFSYCFEDIVSYYNGYLALMTHWHKVYPGEILTVQYEQVVQNPIQSIEAIFDYLQIEVEPSCFEFFKTSRAVRTASSEQVRQPINRKGMEQWQNFEPYLGELLQLLKST
ncbi:tetratricopeptide repeat-containing sulfotransferase family protein [Paraferrimonas sp. SM1919]|uniref:tetratricopeptide repeat-containing sulfotransferase family protein n=1 Tax=Paraferrimonas sp. SM1919 TaxID=2662263 RepID=UPI0013D03756|nr:tetratricopeptide repeat-containing sulfotransferase family protein [Paraferrimonas sp. SM1919]